EWPALRANTVVISGSAHSCAINTVNLPDNKPGTGDTMRGLGIREMVVAIIVSCTIAAGCTSLTGPPAGTSSRVFPNAPGSRWGYAVYHTRDQLRDTITVRILSTTTISDGNTASLWQYTSRYSTDTVY